MARVRVFLILIVLISGAIIAVPGHWILVENQWAQAQPNNSTTTPGAAPPTTPTATTTAAAPQTQESLLDIPITWPTRGLETPISSEYTEPVPELSPQQVGDVVKDLTWRTQSNDTPAHIAAELRHLPAEFLQRHPPIRSAYIVLMRYLISRGPANGPLDQIDVTQTIRQLRQLDTNDPETLDLLRSLREYFSVTGSPRGNLSFQSNLILLVETQRLLFEQASRAGAAATPAQVRDIAVYLDTLRSRIRPLLATPIDQLPHTRVVARTNLRHLIESHILSTLQNSHRDLYNELRRSLVPAQPWRNAVDRRVRDWVNDLEAHQRAGRTLNRNQFARAVRQLINSADGGGRRNADRPSLIDEVLAAGGGQSTLLERGIAILREQVRQAPDERVSLLSEIDSVSPRTLVEQQIIASIFSGGTSSSVVPHRLHDYLYELRPFANQRLMQRLGFGGGTSFGPLLPAGLSPRFYDIYQRVRSLYLYSRNPYSGWRGTFAPSILRVIETGFTEEPSSPAVTLFARIASPVICSIEPNMVAQFPSLIQAAVTVVAANSSLDSHTLRHLRRLMPYLSPDIQLQAWEILNRNAEPPVARIASPGQLSNDVIDDLSRHVVQSVAEAIEETSRRAAAQSRQNSGPQRQEPSVRRSLTPFERAQRQGLIRQIEERYGLNLPNASSARGYHTYREAANDEIMRLELLDETPPARRSQPQPGHTPEQMREVGLRALRQSMGELYSQLSFVPASDFFARNPGLQYDSDTYLRNPSYEDRTNRIEQLLGTVSSSAIENEQAIDLALAELTELYEVYRYSFNQQDIGTNLRLLLEQARPLRLALHRSHFTVSNLRTQLTTLNRPILGATYREANSESVSAAMNHERELSRQINDALTRISTPAEAYNLTEEGFAGASPRHESTNLVGGSATEPPMFRHRASARQQFFTQVAIDELPSATQRRTAIEVISEALPPARRTGAHQFTESIPSLTPVAVPGQTSSFVAIATPLDTRNGHVHSIERLSVTNDRGHTLLEGVDYEVVEVYSHSETGEPLRRHDARRRGYGLRFLIPQEAGIRYYAEFTETAGDRISRNTAVEAPLLPATSVRAISHELRQEGFIAIADRFDRLASRRAPITIESLSNAFRRVSVYSLTPENPAANTDSRFGRFRAFLGLEGNPGVLCAVCNGGNSLFPEILNAVFENAQLPFSAEAITGVAPDRLTTTTTTRNLHRITRVLDTPTGYTVATPDATPSMQSTRGNGRQQALLDQQPLLREIVVLTRRAIATARATPGISRAVILGLINRGRDRLARAVLQTTVHSPNMSLMLHPEDISTAAMQELLATYDELVEPRTLDGTIESPNIEHPAIVTSETRPLETQLNRELVLTLAQRHTLQILHGPTPAHERAMIYHDRRRNAANEGDPETLIRRLSLALESTQNTEGEAHREALREALVLYARLRTYIAGVTEPAHRHRFRRQYADILSFYNIENGTPNAALQRVLNRTQALENIMLGHRLVWQTVLARHSDAFSSLRHRLSAFDNSETSRSGGSAAECVIQALAD